MDLDLAQVRAFLAAAEELHFGRAADRLFLTQQALSKRIARLENELGVQLFTRDARAVQFTEAGRRFLAPARQALADADRAVEAARDPGTAAADRRMGAPVRPDARNRAGHSGRARDQGRDRAQP